MKFYPRLNDDKFWLLVCLTMITSLTIHANNPTPQLSGTRVKQFEEFLVFPVEQVGNAIYRKRHLLQQEETQKILAVTKASYIDAVIYLYQTLEKKFKIGVISSAEEERLKIRDAGFGVYEIRDTKTGIRRLYRIYKQQLNALLPERRSTRDPVTSSTHAIFYHIRRTKKK